MLIFASLNKEIRQKIGKLAREKIIYTISRRGYVNFNTSCPPQCDSVCCDNDDYFSSMYLWGISIHGFDSTKILQNAKDRLVERCCIMCGSGREWFPSKRWKSRFQTDYTCFWCFEKYHQRYFYSVRNLSMEFKINKEILRKQKIPHTKYGCVTFILKEDLDRFLDNRKAKAEERLLKQKRKENSDVNSPRKRKRSNRLVFQT